MAADGHLLFFLFFSLAAAKKDVFHEELLLKPLPTGHVYAHFQFTTIWDVDIRDSKSFSHYNLFPKSFGQIVNRYAVEELHLSLTQGQWQHRWGYPVRSAPPGAELWVWFQERMHDRIDEQWSGLTQALSGQFCASLNFIDSKTTASPKLSFRREGATSASGTNSSLLRHAALPRELVCTENLTPWKKLLPCDSKAGLSTLFYSLLLYSVSYHSLSVDLRPICKDPGCTQFSVELLQSLSLVLDPLLRGGARPDWSLRKLFGRSIKSACPLAETSKVYVDVSSNKTGSEFTLTPCFEVLNKSVAETQQQQFAAYDLKKIISPGNPESVLNIVVKWKSKPKHGNLPQLYAQRFLTGYGEEKGGITSLLHNRHPTDPLPVVYFATFPWFIRIFLHTLTIKSAGKTIKPDVLYVTPAKDRAKPCSLEVMISLPANSVTELSVQFQKGFLKWTEHPPDSHHGFYISSAVISTKMKNSLNHTGRPRHSSLLFPSDGSTHEEHVFVRLHTAVLLVSLPTPDFSMPYNVICLACTVVAIAFGSFHNLSSRRFEIVDPKKVGGIASKVKAALTKIKSKIFGKKNEIATEKKEN